MTRWILCVVVLGACGKSEPRGDALRAHTPVVASAAVMASPPATDKVPVIVLVGADGQLAVAAGPESWAALADFQLPAKLVTLAPKWLWPRMREDLALDRDPKTIVEDLKPVEDDALELDLQDDLTASATRELDDPPPPEEDQPDGGEESGGTGTAMALEEGKMGTSDSGRTEGQYKMHREDGDSARRDARAHALPGPRGRIGDYASLRTADPGRILEYPERLAMIAGAIEDARFPMPHQGVAIAAHPRAKASALVDALMQSEGALLVANGADVRPLRLLFGPATGNRADAVVDRWIEVRLASRDLVIEAVPEKPVVVADLAALAKAYQELVAKYPKARVTDVLVADDVDAQRLVDVLVALDGAGARAIALGGAPAADSPQQKLRGKRIVRFAIGRPNAQGAIDKADIRRVIKRGTDKLRACYEAELAGDAELAGTVQTQLVIDAKGKVVTAESTGVSPGVATCITGVIKTLRFAVPASAGITQVVIAFSMS